MADLYAPGATSGESWTWSPATGWTTDPDSPEANAARAKYEKWLEQTAEEYQQNFGDKAGKSARSPSETDRAEELEAALAKLEHEKKLLAQLLKPLTRPADTEDEARSPLARLDADDAIPAPDRPDPASRRSLDKRSAVRES
jgi:hypothetical protein